MENEKTHYAKYITETELKIYFRKTNDNYLEQETTGQGVIRFIWKITRTPGVTGKCFVYFLE